jgi:hypothetical protein
VERAWYDVGSLFVNTWVPVIASFLTTDARMGRIVKRGLACRPGPLFFSGPAHGLEKLSNTECKVEKLRKIWNS